MTFKLEDGTGVVGANSFASVAFADSYLTLRNRQETWDCVTDTIKEAALIAGTDYIGTRWGLKFKGSKEFVNFTAARATLTFTVLPTNAETVTVEGSVYVYETVPTGGLSIGIGTSVAEALANLITAIGELAVDVSALAGVEDTMLIQSLVAGTAGNSIVISTTVTGATWSSSTLLGGSDAPQSQPLTFPRANLFDHDRVLVVGIPEKLKQATVEYATRALIGSLFVDPTLDDSGRTIQKFRERIGPIEEETVYETGANLSQITRPYPAADRLLAEYVIVQGRVIRG